MLATILNYSTSPDDWAGLLIVVAFVIGGWAGVHLGVHHERREAEEARRRAAAARRARRVEER